MTWPASFFTGPLGADNVLPPTESRKFLANQPGGSPPTARANFEARQATSGCIFDIYHFHYDGSLTASYDGVFGCEDPTDTAGAAPGGVTQEQYALNNGSYPMVAWQPDYTVAEMLTGDADDIWTKLGTHWAAYAPDIIIWRPFPEFNLPTRYGIYAGGASPVVSPSDFRAAWQRMVSTIQSAGATNVAFVYNMDEGNNRDYVNSCYPGDAYVDWVASDNYNRCHVTAPTCFSTPLHAGFAEWDELFNYSHGTGLATSNNSCIAGAGNCRTWSMYDIFGSGVATRNTLVRVGTDLPADLPTQKPFFIAETGSIYDNTDATTQARKGQFWTRTISRPFGIGSMDQCIGKSDFDADVHSSSDFDFRVDSNAAVLNVSGTSDPATLAAWATMASDALFCGTSPPVTPTELEFGVPPTDTVFNETITPSVTVRITDSGGNRDITSTAAVTIAIGTNPAGGTLSGTLTVNAVAGIATFSDLSIDMIGVGYTLEASSPGLTSDTSSAFDITDVIPPPPPVTGATGIYLDPQIIG